MNLFNIRKRSLRKESLIKYLCFHIILKNKLTETKQTLQSAMIPQTRSSIEKVLRNIQQKKEGC